MGYKSLDINPKHIYTYIHIHIHSYKRTLRTIIEHLKLTD